MTSNILRLSSVNRTLVNKVITCEASNTDLSLPLHTSLQLDLVLAPVEVTISSPTNSMILGQELTLTCTVVGARPIPNIVWEGDYKTAFEVQYKVRSISTLFLWNEISDGSPAIRYQVASKCTKSKIRMSIFFPNLNFWLKIGKNIQIRKQPNFWKDLNWWQLVVQK